VLALSFLVTGIVALGCLGAQFHFHAGLDEFRSSVADAIEFFDGVQSDASMLLIQTHESLACAQHLSEGRSLYRKGYTQAVIDLAQMAVASGEQLYDQISTIGHKAHTWHDTVESLVSKVESFILALSIASISVIAIVCSMGAYGALVPQSSRWLLVATLFVSFLVLLVGVLLVTVEFFFSVPKSSPFSFIAFCFSFFSISSFVQIS
jgi:hypothetical protein